MPEIDFKPFVNKHKRDISAAQQIKNHSDGKYTAFLKMQEALVKKARESMYSIRSLSDKGVWDMIIREWIHTKY
jgi:hypothetical protein